MSLRDLIIKVSCKFLRDPTEHMLEEAEAVALRLPSWVNVPAGALNTTGVISNRNELVLRSASRCQEAS